MKTKVLKMIAIAIFISGIAGISYGSSFTDIKKENRSVGSFDEISLAIPANVYLTQGNICEVIIEADEDILSKIETEVQGGELDIKFEKWFNYRGTGKINVYITVKDINKLVVSGSGDIYAKSAIKSDKIGLIVTGSGSVIMDELITNNVYAMISGSGDIKIAGTNKSNELNATITGSGDFESENIAFAKADLTITGSGSMRVNVSGDLDATITGSGRVSYKGKPVVNANITGSGKIRSDD